MRYQTFQEVIAKYGLALGLDAQSPLTDWEAALKAALNARKAALGSTGNPSLQRKTDREYAELEDAVRLASQMNLLAALRRCIAEDRQERFEWELCKPGNLACLPRGEEPLYEEYLDLRSQARKKWASIAFPAQPGAPAEPPVSAATSGAASASPAVFSTPPLTPAPPPPSPSPSETAPIVAPLPEPAPAAAQAQVSPVAQPPPVAALASTPPVQPVPPPVPVAPSMPEPPRVEASGTLMADLPPPPPVPPPSESQAAAPVQMETEVPQAMTPEPAPPHPDQARSEAGPSARFTALLSRNSFKIALLFVIVVFLLALGGWIKSLYSPARTAGPATARSQARSATPVATNLASQAQIGVAAGPVAKAQPAVIPATSNQVPASPPTVIAVTAAPPVTPTPLKAPPTVTTQAPIEVGVVPPPSTQPPAAPVTNLAPPPVVPARLEVQSLPPGATATVLVENERQSRQTPTTFEGLKPGSYAVELTLEGYRLTNQVVWLDPGTNRTLVFQMRKLQSLVRILAEPRDAQISVDGQVQPGFEPGGTLALEVGPHQFQVALPGYRPLTTNIHVGAQSTVIDLGRLAPQTGVLAINSTPAGARVRVNGTDTGNTTPWRLEGAPGLYKVNLLLEGYEPAERSITLHDGDNIVSNVFLSRLANTRKVVILTSPLGARVKIDGQERAEKTMAQFDLPIGHHDIEVTKPGFAPYRYSLDLVAGDQAYALTLVLGSEDIPDLIAACERRAAELKGGTPFASAAQADEELQQWEEWGADHSTQLKNSRRLRNLHAQLVDLIKSKRPAQ